MSCLERVSNSLLAILSQIFYYSYDESDDSLVLPNVQPPPIVNTIALRSTSLSRCSESSAERTVDKKRKKKVSSFFTRTVHGSC